MGMIRIFTGGFSCVTLLAISACSLLPRQEVSIRGARVLSSSNQSLVFPRGFLENEGLQGRIAPVAITLSGADLRKIASGLANASVGYTNCDTDTEIDHSFGPFINGIYLSSLDVDAIESNVNYDLLGTIAVGSLRKTPEICVYIFKSYYTGRRAVSGRVKLSISDDDESGSKPSLSRQGPTREPERGGRQRRFLRL